jgi:hypothetical protein
MAVLLVLGAGAFTYALAWRWYRSHAASALAGLLYAASPIALARISTCSLRASSPPASLCPRTGAVPGGNCHPKDQILQLGGKAICGPQRRILQLSPAATAYPA